MFFSCHFRVKKLSSLLFFNTSIKFITLQNVNAMYLIKNRPILLTFLLLFFLLNLPTFAQKNGITFSVCDVEKADTPLPVKPYIDVLIQKTILPKQKKSYFSTTKDSSHLSQLEAYPIAVEQDSILATGIHAFVGAVHLAYKSHRPLTLSPDMIWLLIAQGFAIHVQENAESLRKHFVDFEGKKELHIKRDQFVKGSKQNDWLGVFPEFSQKIKEQMGGDLHKLIVADFSTSTPATKAAFEITLMDAMGDYFTYSMSTLCGIPEITLTGTPEDWALIEEKTKALSQYDLAWWTESLLPTLAQFTATVKGEMNTEFWQDMYKLNAVGSGNPYITGWLTQFFPYLGNRQHYKNPILEIDQAATNQQQITTADFPIGLSKADVEWNYYGIPYTLAFYAGFMGIRQDNQTLALSPDINWVIIDHSKQSYSDIDDVEASDYDE